MKTAKVNSILHNPKQQWKQIVASNHRGLRLAYRKLEVDWVTYNIKDYLFTHDTIVASVATEDDRFTIKKGCEELVNANGNAWTNDVLMNCYKTFVGAENYQDHVQIPSLSKGKVLDAILREVTHNGNKIYMVDILVATSREHKNLVERIERGELNTLSMGATAKFVQCSVCGKIFDAERPNKPCEHLQDSIGKYVLYNGKKRFCAELCGAIDPKTREYIEDSCVFIEASWVEQPAFAGAVTNYLIETPELAMRRAETKQLESEFSNVFAPTTRVADKKGLVVNDLMVDFIKRERMNSIVRDILKI